ncbi:MAG: O-antigen ligase family protein [Gammaproteobacteria bacterium]|nr:O-antigen ligase family protein [Gammaproteobacteria bacterium]
MESKVEKNLLLAARVLTTGIPLFLVTGRAAVDIALSLVALLFLARSFISKDWAWARAGWFRIGLVLWVWTLLISAAAFDVAASYGQAATWIRFLLFAAALGTWVLDATWIRRLIAVGMAMLLFVALDAWLQYFTGVDIFGHQRVEDRLTGPFDDLRVGIYITKLFFPVALGFALWQLRARGKGWPMWLTAGAAIVMIGAVFVSGERMALILMMFGLILAAVLQKGVLRAAIGGVLALALIGIGVVAAIDEQMMKRQFMSTAEAITNFSHTHYGVLWRSAIQLGGERPVTGVGMRNFRVACDDPKIGLPSEKELRCGTHPHNTYLEWFSESGIPGLILFVTMIAALGRQFWSAWKVIGDNRAWMAGPVIAFILQLWPLAATGSFFSNWNGALLWLAAGWALAAARLGGYPIPPASRR